MFANDGFLRRYGWPLLSGVLALALISVLVIFGVFGRVADTPSNDGRTRVLLNNTERDFVLAEMRNLLHASQSIIDAVLAGDMQRAADHARRVGTADVQNVPLEIRGPLLGKLPLEFKELGMSIHKGMDTLALDAETLGDRDHTLGQLSELMNRCVACHASYTVLPPPQ